MPPEQLEGKEADGRADIFAFGAVLYEMLTGQKAFAGTSRASVIAAIMSSHPRSIASLRPATPPILEQIVDRCLAKDPDERWQSVHDLSQCLLWSAELAPLGQSSPVAPNRLKTAVALSILGVALAAVVFGIVVVSREAKPPALPTVRFEFLVRCGWQRWRPWHLLRRARQPGGHAPSRCRQ